MTTTVMMSVNAGQKSGPCAPKPRDRKSVKPVLSLTRLS
jgi:hypothetical protein